MAVDILQRSALESFGVPADIAAFQVPANKAIIYTLFTRSQIIPKIPIDRTPQLKQSQSLQDLPKMRQQNTIKLSRARIV